VIFMTVQVQFLPDDITITAEPGEPLLEVAQRAGVFIPTGCLMGSCHACEVELDNGIAICACISSVPRGKESLTINLYDDPDW
jgi:ferredoxin